MRCTVEQRLLPLRMVLALVGLWCAVTGAAAAAQVEKRATPAPTFREPIDDAPFQAIRAYLRDLVFLEQEEFGDRQALLVGRYPDSARYGPLAMIQPEAGNYLISDEDLTRGRIIARIVNESPDSYPRLGLLPLGTTYWWVEYDPGTRRGRSILLAADRNGDIVRRQVSGLQVQEYHKDYRALQPWARFIWREIGELGWAPCASRCCRLNTEDGRPPR